MAAHASSKLSEKLLESSEAWSTLSPYLEDEGISDLELGLRVQGLGFGVWGLGFRVQGLEFSGFRVFRGLGFSGLGLRLVGLRHCRRPNKF